MALSSFQVQSMEDLSIAVASVLSFGGEIASYDPNTVFRKMATALLRQGLLSVMR